MIIGYNFSRTWPLFCFLGENKDGGTEVDFAQDRLEEVFNFEEEVKRKELIYSRMKLKNLLFEFLKAGLKK